MWNYQEILTELMPSVVIEFGTHAGGSALYFAELLKLITQRSRVLTIDIDHSRVAERARKCASIEFLQSDSTTPIVADRIRDVRAQYPGKAFFILDSDHRKTHVLAELLQIRKLSESGDYVVVEDGNINGHPVLPSWGEGPYEALEAYVSEFPSDYKHDTDRENKFGFTFAPNGFLIRQ